MRKQITPTVERLFIGPLRDLADTTFLLITSPASVAREFAGQDGHQFARAVTYFVAAVSAAVILNKIASWALGIETIEEVPYWTFYVFTVLCIAFLAALLAFPLGPAPPTLFLKAVFLAYGACFLIAGFLVAGASLTLAGLREFGYIPDFRPDPTSYENFTQIGNQAYFDCLREESMLFNVVYHGVEGRFDTLNHPIDDLSYVQTILLIAAWLLFAVLAFFGADRRRWVAAIAAGLSVGIFTGVTSFGLKVWVPHLHAKSPCSASSLDAAEQKIAVDYVRKLTENYSKEIGRDRGNGFVITSVEQRQLSVILRVQSPKHAQGVEGFAKWARSTQQEVTRNYCSSEGDATLFRKLGVSRVWVYRHADTDLVETVVESADLCRR